MPTIFSGNRFYIVYLLGDACRGSVKFKKQGRNFLVIQFGIAVDGGHGNIIKQLGPGNGDCRLDYLDHRGNGVFNRGERTYRRGNGFGDTIKAKADFRNDAERSF